jgi:hypothetical protein
VLHTARRQDAELLDALHAAHDLALSRAATYSEVMTLVGYGVVHLMHGDGSTKAITPFANLITDVGDDYYAKKMIVGISPASPSAPTAANGMKLGTGTTAASKSGAGAAIVTYISGSNIAFDTSYPQTASLGAGLGVNAVYKTTWAAGTATNSAITEAALVTDQGTNGAGGTSTTYHRGVFTAQNKTASDPLAVVWNVKALGT